MIVNVDDSVVRLTHWNVLGIVHIEATECHSLTIGSLINSFIYLFIHYAFVELCLQPGHCIL